MRRNSSSRITLLTGLLATVLLTPASVLAGSSGGTPTADLSVTMSDQPDPYNGLEDLRYGGEDGITYFVRVRNNSATTNSASVNMSFLPGGLEFKSASTSRGSCVWKPSPSPGLLEVSTGDPAELDCALGDLGPRQVVNVTVNMAACIGDPFRSYGADSYVSSSTRDPNFDNDYDQELTKVVMGTRQCEVDT